MKRKKNNIRDLIKDSRKLYSGFLTTHSPILNTDIYFTSEGFNHLIYQSNGKPRKISEQYLKLKCLPFVLRVIERSKVISEIREVSIVRKGKVKKATQYKLIHEASPRKKIGVVVMKIGDGKYKFHSVMRGPSTRTKKRR